MSPTLVPRRPERPDSKLGARFNILDVLPVELRLKIYGFLYTDIISELSDNLFGVFSLYDVLYDYTGPNLRSHVGKTGLTALLYTCKAVHDEALEALCNETEFVVNLMGDDDGDDEERIKFRFSEGSHLLSFAKNLKVNLEPLSDETNGRFVSRIRHFSNLINNGVTLRSLQIRLSGTNLKSPQSLDDILSALSSLQTTGSRIKVYLGEVAEELLSAERLDIFIDAINGVYMGRGHHVLEPDYYEGSDSEDSFF